ncbi:glycoside hydrolase family 3 N-terminal domain-containing protein [Algibacter sp. L3A6]|uniref:glycoside hydrolase family 3 N-terminal domain-containing protein n=1 Tax=Algibacter sp. L3A6 TaxID=2686366 RepID=UPI0018EED009|nr:glycoside hydrolase family 3 N-terminal domain-containing protein [Algibacter sp. L3A6]
MVTLYGYGRVAKDELPTENWKNEIWKDGLANIDEHLNNVGKKSENSNFLSPPSLHRRALNEVQRWFIEETRLGIPVEFTNEGIRGLCFKGATCFPAQIGVGSTWNTELINKIGKITGEEARVNGYTNVYSPILDLARDPRWGRVVECYGEDPYLVSQYGKAMVKGLQSQNIISTAKHFAVYGSPKGGRDGKARTDPHVNERELHDMYLEPFRVAIQEAGAMGVMSSYNDYNGVPITSSNYFLTEILRNQFRFKGYVVSDSWAVGGLEGRHKIADSYKETVRLAVLAGLNVRTNFNAPQNYIKPLRELISEGAIPVSVIDNLVKDVLRVKFTVGLFDNPYGVPEKADEITHSSENEKIALQASRESMVLLKNENQLLPIDIKQWDNILVTGPNATNKEHSLSRYGPSDINVITVLDGIQTYVGKQSQINYFPGCDITDPNFPENELYPMPFSDENEKMISDAAAAAKNNDLIIAVLGESEHIVGESRSRTSLNLPPVQRKLMDELIKTGKPIVVVLINGRVLTINRLDRDVPAILEAWFPGEYGGQAIAETLFGSYNPGGKLPVTFPRSVGQVPYNFPTKQSAQAGQHAKGPNGIGNTRVSSGLYPFGYGLSYTNFEYSNFVLSTDTATANSELTIQCVIKNTGKYKGDEVAQLYISDEVSSVVTYEKVLRGFKRISLKPGEEQLVVFNLNTKDLSLLNNDMVRVTEPGRFIIEIGSSSKDIRLKGSFNVE